MKEKAIRSEAHWQAYEFDSPEQVASEVARRFLEFSIEGEPKQTIGLSGGRITGLLFREISRQAKISAVPMEQLRFFWADERCVPLDDPESNYRLARELLFEPLEIQAHQQFPYSGGESAEKMTQDGKRMIHDHFGTQENETPIFDLIFLGMGEDGHIASLFPENRSEDRHRNEVCFDVIASKPPPSRITLSYPVIAAAKEVWLVVSGSGKAQVLAEALQSSGETPLKHLLSLRKHTKIFTDISLSGVGRLLKEGDDRA